jgi:hypothetical protein
MTKPWPEKQECTPQEKHEIMKKVSSLSGKESYRKARLEDCCPCGKRRKKQNNVP